MTPTAARTTDEPEAVGVGPWPGDVARRPAPRPGAARATATGATSSTATATGGARRSSPTSTRAGTPFHVAIENWQHDFNIGTVVRTANAFLAARGAHRRPPAVEPARRDGHRPLPARPPPRRRRRPRRLGRRRERCRSIGIDNLPGSVPLGDVRAARGAACCCSARRARACRRGARAACAPMLLDRAVRLDPLDQRRRRRGDRHAPWIRQHADLAPHQP